MAPEGRRGRRRGFARVVAASARLAAGSGARQLSPTVAAPSATAAAVVAAPGQARVIRLPAPQPGAGRGARTGRGLRPLRLEPPGLGGPSVVRLPAAAGRARARGVGRRGRERHSVWRCWLRSRRSPSTSRSRPELLVSLPPELDGRPFPGEAVGCAMNVFARSGIRTGDEVAVVGAGFLGLLLVQLAVGRRCPRAPSSPGRVHRPRAGALVRCGDACGRDRRELRRRDRGRRRPADRSTSPRASRACAGDSSSPATTKTARARSTSSRGTGVESTSSTRTSATRAVVAARRGGRRSGGRRRPARPATAPHPHASRLRRSARHSSSCAPGRRGSSRRW